MTERELLREMLTRAVDASDSMTKVVILAEETPIPGWLAQEITRITLALGHVEAQLRLDLDAA